MNKIISKEIDLNGRTLKLETGKLALQADAAVVASWGETVVLATVVTQLQVVDVGYFPLSVEFVEKHYAGGRISSSRFIKREARPSEEAVLTGRLIDRSIRPFFPKEFTSEVQVIVTVLSIDQINDPDILGLIAASAALSISSVPWHGPLGVARIGAAEGKLMVNPTIDELVNSNLDLFMASTRETVAMIEAKGSQVSDEVVFNAIKEAHASAQPIISLIEEFVKEAGKEKLSYSTLAEEVEEALLKEVKQVTKERIEQALFDEKTAWHDSMADQIKSELTTKYTEVLTPLIISGVFDKVAKEIMNDLVLGQGKRVDGRAMDEVRPIEIEIGVLPRTHGSALFSRGDSQILSVVTLGAPSLGQTIEGMEGERIKRFMHYYNMGINPFSTGEVKRIGPPTRRDIGHGALGEKSLESVIPTKEQFPYAIRIVSEVLGANASTSQAAICAASLALLDAGVPIEPVAGIAIGLISNSPSPDKFQTLTDMRAVEDFYGEMDFKIAGTKNGITGIQMDTKLEGLTFDVIEKALELGKKARLEILDKMNKVLPAAGTLSPHAPRVEILHIKPEEIGLLIGPGGKNINGIIGKTGAQIDVEDDGTVMVSGTKSEGVDQAMAAIEGMFKTVNVGDEFTGKVVRLVPFGAFVEIAPGKDGLVHVSEMSTGFVGKPEDVVSEGQEVKVRVKGVDPDGKVSLSMLFGADIKPESENRPRSSGGFRPRSSFGDRPRRPSFSDRLRFGGGFNRSGPSRSSGGFDRNRGGRPARRSFDR